MGEAGGGEDRDGRAPRGELVGELGELDAGLVAGYGLADRRLAQQLAGPLAGPLAERQG